MANVTHLNVGQVTMNSTTPVRVLAANSDRVRVQLRGGLCFFGPNDTVSATNGFIPLDTNPLTEFSYTGEIWAIGHPSNPGITTIYFAEETT
jgi:hypothetical protein